MKLTYQEAKDALERHRCPSPWPNAIYKYPCVVHVVEAVSDGVSPRDAWQMWVGPVPSDEVLEAIRKAGAER